MNNEYNFSSIKRIALVVCLCICVCIITGCSNNTNNNTSTTTNTEAPTAVPEEKAKTVKIEITPENFNQYFDVSVDVYNESSERETNYFGLIDIDISADVSLDIVAKYPCELHNVNFSITASGGAFMKTVITDSNTKNLTFKGTIPQSGSYSNSKQVSFKNLTYFGTDYEIKYYLYHSAITQASGYIIMDADDQ